MANVNNDNINIYVVTYNCNDMKLTGDATSIENFVTRVINNKVPIYNPNQKTIVETTNVTTASAIQSDETPEVAAARPSEENTGVNIDEKKIFIFGIQEAPYVSSDKYKHMLTTIITKLNNNNNTDKYNYYYYYFDKTTISKTKLFIIYNDKNINVDDEKFIDLSKSFKNKFNKHALRVTIKHNKTSILTVITTHLRKGHLAPFFINDLKELFKGDVYTDNIILFGDLNSRTLYRAIGSHGSFESYNDVNSSKITHIKETLESLKDIPLFQLSTNNPKFINTLKHKNYYHSDRNIEFSNATNTLKNPTYRYNKETTIPTLNYRKTKKKVKVLGRVLSIFQRSKDKSKDKVKDEDEGKFKVPSYPDRVLYKSNTNLKLINDSAHVLEYTGSDHLPVIVKFTYSVPVTAAKNSAPAPAEEGESERPTAEEAVAASGESESEGLAQTENAVAELTSGKVEELNHASEASVSGTAVSASTAAQTEGPTQILSQVASPINLSTADPNTKMALLKSFNSNSNRTNKNNIKIYNIQIDGKNVLDSTFEYKINNINIKLKLSDLENLDGYNLKYDQKIKLLNKFIDKVDNKSYQPFKKSKYKYELESFLKQKLKGGKKKLSKKLFIKNKKQTKKTN